MDLLRLELRRFLAARHRGADLRVRARNHRGTVDWSRRQRRGLSGSSQGDGSRRNTKREFQKVPALHDLFLAGLKL
jgi:hypothetical protein